MLEVGAGQAPHGRTDVVVEKYLFDDHERPGEATFCFARPVVVGDAERLPFADGAFAYSICLHVLEHATEPGLFAGELARVSSAGFVQVPSRVSELTFGWSYHPWLIDWDGDRLRFEPKAGRSAPCGPSFHELYARDELTRVWFDTHRSLWHHSVEWAGTLPVESSGPSAPESAAADDVATTVLQLSELATGKGNLQRLPQPVRDALRCPGCGALLVDDAASLRCVGCTASYPAPGGVPVLLLAAAQ